MSDTTVRSTAQRETTAPPHPWFLETCAPATASELPDLTGFAGELLHALTVGCEVLLKSGALVEIAPGGQVKNGVVVARAAKLRLGEVTRVKCYGELFPVVIPVSEISTVMVFAGVSP